MAKTARQIIVMAYKMGGIISANESPQPQDMTDALSLLNDIMDSISNDIGMQRFRVIDTITIPSALSQYTYGVGGVLNFQCPIDIIHVTARNGEFDYELDRLSDDQFSNISLKSQQGLPIQYNFDQRYPIGTLKFYPIPPAGTVVTILSEKALGNYALDDMVTMPIGFDLYIQSLLGIYLCSLFNVGVPDGLAKMHNDAAYDYKTKTLKLKPIKVTDTLDGSYNILSGRYL